MSAHDRPKFLFRAQFHGMLTWTCPYCGRANSCHLHPSTYKIECTCYRKFIIGYRLQVIKTGPQKTPRDQIIPIDTMQPGHVELTPYDNEHRHELVTD